MYACPAPQIVAERDFYGFTGRFGLEPGPDACALPLTHALTIELAIATMRQAA